MLTEERIIAASGAEDNVILIARFFYGIRTRTKQEAKTLVMKTPVQPGEILREDALADLGLGASKAAPRLGVYRVALGRRLEDVA